MVVIRVPEVVTSTLMGTKSAHTDEAVFRLNDRGPVLAVAFGERLQQQAATV